MAQTCILNQEVTITAGILQGVKGNVVGFDATGQDVWLAIDEHTNVVLTTDMIAQSAEKR